MSSIGLIVVITVFALVSYWFGLNRAVAIAGGRANVKYLHSLPQQFGTLTALVCGLPALLLLLIWTAVETNVINALIVESLPVALHGMNATEQGLYLNDIYLLAQQLGSATAAEPDKLVAAEYLVELQNKAAFYKTNLIILVAVASVLLLIKQFSATFQARVYAEKIIKLLFLSCSVIAILTTIGIVMSVLFESMQFFSKVPVSEFLFGTKWSPQIAMHAEQVASSGAFGAVPLFAGTLLITFIAMCIAAPIGLMTAVYLSQYASPRLRNIAKPMLEVLAGIPTVVYGFFAALTVAPFIRNFGESLGLSVASESALAAGVVMGVMIIPFVSSLSDDAINAVPKSLKEGALGLGSTPSETIKQVLLPAALPGIVGAMLLAISRAVGETMIVVMAAGLAANLTANPLDAVTTVTVQIVTLLTGDQEFDSPKTLAAFALGLMLFVTTLILNVIALKVVRKYREQYD